MKSEKDVKKKTKVILDRHGWFWWMIPANGYGKSGVSDFHAFKTGTFMAIETKFGSNKPTALQIGFLNSVRREDGFGFVVNDKNIDWLEVFCAAFGRSTAAASRGEKPDANDGATMLNAIAELSNKLLDV